MSQRDFFDTTRSGAVVKEVEKPDLVPGRCPKCKHRSIEPPGATCLRCEVERGEKVPMVEEKA